MPDEADFDKDSSVHSVPNTPNLTKGLRAERLSIESTDQAVSICNSLIEENRDRVLMAKQIQEAIDSIDPPMSPQALEESGKGWMSNITTGILTSIVERILPRLVMRVKTAPSLTASSLPVTTPDYATKTSAYRKSLTDLIRSWPKFNIAAQNLAKEMIDHGYSFAYWTNPIDWKPKIARMDRAYVPNGTEQGEPPQFFMVREYYRVNELWSMIEDRESAEDSGFDIDNMVEAINDAAPIFIPNDGDETEARQFEDLKREVVTSYGYAQGSNTVEVWHLFSTEYDGRVSQWMIDSKTNNLLFRADSRYDSMDDVVVIVPFQIGNGTVHGSLGAGKICYDLAAEAEKNRNSAMDSFRNRGRLAIEFADPADMPENPLVIDDIGMYVQGGRFAGNSGMLPENAQAFVMLDEFLRKIMQEKVGVYLFEPIAQENPRTATEAQIIALQGEELKNSVLDNFLSSFARVVAAISRRAFGGTSDDPSAEAARDALLKIMDEDELDELIKNTPTQTIIDINNSDTLRIVDWVRTKMGNPMYNQHELQRLEGSLSVPLEIVDQVLLPINDPTEDAEQVRLQLMEINQIINGTPMPVSPRDNHLIHIQTLVGQTDPETGQNMGPVFAQINAARLQEALALLNHLMIHADYAGDQLGEGSNDLKEFIRVAEDAIEQLQAEFIQAENQESIIPIER